MKISVVIKPDKDGYTGRECPECEKYFKIVFGTGLPGANDCHCPYCNCVAPHDKFWTKQQVEYAKSVALNRISGDLLKQMKKLERRPNPNAFISIGIKVKGSPTPIAYYLEFELEERVECSSCTLKYAIYGSFGYCPDCGIHNSRQIVIANFELITKILDLANKSDEPLKAKLIENSLEDAVSAFDGFGREHCSKLGGKISFQSIYSAQELLQRSHNVDISAGLSHQQWEFVCEQFQKRHLLAHKFGIMDEEFVAKTSKSNTMVGKKVSISESDVRQLLQHLSVVTRNLYDGVPRS